MYAKRLQRERGVIVVTGSRTDAQTARDIIEASRYLVLATADAHWILAKDGQPDHRIPVPLS